MRHPKIDFRNPTEIADELDRDGVACLENAVPAYWLAEARAGIENLLSSGGEKDHFIRSPQGSDHIAVEAFISSLSVRALMHDIVCARFPHGAAEAVLTGTALRVIAGPKGEGDAFWFHFDASALTMVVPIYLPDAGRGSSGELVGYFNKRPFRRFVLANIVDKWVLQSGYYRSRILRRLDRSGDIQTVDMEVGNVYLFWGYRSLHANMPCAPHAVRATLLLHFGRVHGDSAALKSAIRLQSILRRLATSQ